MHPVHVCTRASLMCMACALQVVYLTHEVLEAVVEEHPDFEVPYRKLRAWAFWGRLRAGGIIRARIIQVREDALTKKQRRLKDAQEAIDKAEAEESSSRGKPPTLKKGADDGSGMTLQLANQLLARMDEMKRELLDTVDTRLAERLDERLDEYEHETRDVAFRGDWLAA